MKINNIEEEIVKKFVKKNKQERILWELSNSKKRDKIFLRFADSSILESSCLKEIGYLPPDEMKKYLLKIGKNMNVYFVGEGYIGEMPLEKAVCRANTGEICIIYCGNGVGYYQGEQEYGKPPRFVLSQKE